MRKIFNLKTLVYALILSMSLSTPLTAYASNGEQANFYEKVKKFILGEEEVDETEVLSEFRRQFHAGNNNMSKVLENTEQDNISIQGTSIASAESETQAMCGSMELNDLVPMGPYNIQEPYASVNKNYGFGVGESSETTVRVDVKKSVGVDSDYNVVGATLLAQGEHSNVWIVNPDEYYSENAGTFTMSADDLYTIGNVVATDAKTAQIAINADVIYEKMTSVQEHAGVLVDAGYSNMAEFGDIDSDGKINLIMYDIQSDAQSGSNSYTAGYFYMADYITTYTGFAIDAVHMDIGLGQGVNSATGEIKDAFYGTFAHEFQHSLFYTYFGGHVSSSTPYSWVNEGLSGVADLYYSDFTTSSVPDSQNLSFGRVSTGTINSYESGTSYGDFVNFNGLKGYGMSYMMSAMMEERSEGYINKAYEYFLTNLVKSTKSGYTYSRSSSSVNYSGKSVPDTWGEVFRAVLGNSVDTSGLSSDEVMEYVYIMFMESYMSAGGRVIDDNITTTTDRIWRNGGSLWSYRNGNKYYIASENVFYNGNSAYELISSGGDVTLVGYPSNSSSIDATHEMAYTLDKTNYDIDSTNTINISIPETEGLRAYVALYEAKNANPLYGTTNYINYNYDAILDTADLYPIELGTDNYVTVDSDSIVPHLFVFTYYKDVNTTVTYDWVDTRDNIDDIAMVELLEKSYDYDGLSKEPLVTVSHRETSAILTEDTDYTITYSDNINAGQATVTIEGMGAYKGSVSVDFEILPISIVNSTILGISNRYSYTGAAITPSFSVTINGATLEADTDYTYTFTDNVAITKKGYLTIQGIGNYKESIGAYFEIYN